jgi:DNA processing protein
VAIVVEAEQTAGDLAAAGLAEALDRTVAAVPGRVTSPLSQGTNALLARGARIVRDAQDVLELLYEIDPSRARTAKSAPEPAAGAPLDARLRSLLERVGTGSDTPDSLARQGTNLGAVLAGLSELELMGLLSRGDGGRYLPSGPPPATTRIPNS